MVRRLLVLLNGLALMLLALTPLALQAEAAPGDPFPSGGGLVFVAQGTALGQPTTLYKAEQGTGEITFVREGAATIGYNAMGFREADRYLYAINNNNGLVRVGQGGTHTALGQVGLPDSTNNYNQGTFGAGTTANTLYVRRAASDRNLYAVDVVSRTSSRVGLSANVPNVSDLVWVSGYLWGVYGEGNRLYRIHPETGEVISVPTPTLPANPYGAQWVYGNGNIGISNNVTGRVYQLQLHNPTSNNPSLTIVSSTRGPANTQNDGAAYSGAPADLGITKEGPATWSADEVLTYTLRVHNFGPGDSSGYIVTDDLPARLVDPATSSPGCEITGTGSEAVMTCTAAALAAGADGPAITITGRAPAQPGTDCDTGAITNTAHVLGNEDDARLTNNTATSTACPEGSEPPSFSVAKTASASAPSHVKPGDTVTYTITVTNTGSADYTAESPASFADNLANVVDDATVDAGSITGDAALTNSTITWSGPLAVDETHIVTYQVTVNDPNTGDHVLRNALVPGGTGSCATSTGCEAETPVADFRLSKTASPASVQGGETVTYSLSVLNVGAVPFGPDGAGFAVGVVEDSLAGVLPHADYNDDASDGGVLVGDTLRWQLDLAVGASATLTYSVTVHSDVAPDAVLTNVARPNSYGRCASASTCTTSTPVRAFTIAKSASPSTVRPGEKVAYRVTVSNIGGGDFTSDVPASFTDDLSDVLDDAVYNGDASAGATVSGTTLSWSGPLPVGATRTITYSVTVNRPATGNLRLTNTAAPGSAGACSGACVTAQQVVSVTAFTVGKAASATTARPGDTVTYTVTVTNTGDTPFTSSRPAAFTDDLSDVLDDAVYNDDASSGATVVGSTLGWSGPLALDETRTITYSVTINRPADGDHRLANAVIPVGEGGTCAGACFTMVTVTEPSAASRPPALPHTGSGVLPLTALALLLLATGWLLTWRSRRASTRRG